MKFRKKTIIEAEQWYPELDIKGVCHCTVFNFWSAHVHTMHDNQLIILKPGDWVVKEPDGIHYYPIDPQVMEDTYVRFSVSELVRLEGP